MATFADRLPPSLRGLLRQKRFSALAIVSLGMGIALNTTMYSVTDALLFPRVAMRNPQDLYRMPFYGDFRQHLTAETKRDVVKSLTFFEEMAYRGGVFFATNLAEAGAQSKTARVLNVSTNYFTMLGVTAMAGRVLNDGDANSAARPVVVSERFWRQMFPDRLMRDTASFTLDGDPRTVVGVIAYESDFPGENTDMWQIPPGLSSTDQTRFVFNLFRMKPGVTIEQAYAELNAAAKRLEKMAGDGENNARFDLERIINGPMRVQNFHVAVIGAVAFVLLVACFNVANLQLARGLSRTKELATRAAVGATRGDLVRLLVLESAWVAGAGLLLGIVLTFWGIYFVKSQVPTQLESYLVRPQVSWRLFAFATLTSGLALTIVGLVPALRVSRVDVNELIKSGAGTGSMRKSRWQAGGLVVLQVGLALALMVGATFTIRAAAMLYQLDINPLLEKVVVASMNVRPAGPTERRRMSDVSTQLIIRAQAIPGVVAAATQRSESPPHHTISIAHAPDLPHEVATGLWNYRYVSADYPRLLGMTITKGRDFTPNEVGASVIMDAGTAKYLWPGQDPIGRQLKFGSDTRKDDGWLTVVGVAKYVNTWSSFRRANQAEREAPQLGAVWVLNSMDTAKIDRGVTGAGYVRTSQIQVYARGSEKVERLPLVLRQALADQSAGFQVWYTERLQSQLQLEEVRKVQDFVAGLFTSFAMIALALSSLGVYAVVSHTVSQRTREIGVRVALGATSRHIRQSVLHHGNVMALSGIAVGLLVAWATNGRLSRFSIDGSTSDVVLFAVAAAVLFTATLLASYVPARRAMRINPVEALRAE